MKNFFIICTVLVTGIMFMDSCKKETTIKEEYNPNITVYGTWMVVGSPSGNYANFKYLQFTTSKILRTYSTNNTGFKTANSASFIPYPDQFLADLAGMGTADVYNYRVSGDTLIIEMGGIEVLRALKSSETQVAGWSEDVASSDLISGVFNNLPYGIGFDGTNILVADYGNRSVVKINMATRLPNGTIDASGSYPTTVEFDGTDIWVSSNGFSYMDRHALAGGAIIGKSPALGPWIYGIAYDPAGGDLWAFANNTDTLYQVDIASNTVISRRYIGSGFRDMAWSNGKLFLTYGPYIYRVNTASFTIEKTYKLKNPGIIYGIAAIGNDFWLNIDGNKMMKVTLN